MSNKPKPLGPYLWRREDSQFIWFRMAVPRRYRDVAGKAKIQESLGTANLAEARRLRNIRKDQLLASWHALAFGGMSNSLKKEPISDPIERFKPTLQDLEEAAVIVGYEIPLADARRQREGLLSLGHWAYDISKDVATTAHKDQAIANAAGDLSAVDEQAGLAIDALGFDIAHGSPDYVMLCEFISQARYAATKLEIKRAAGDRESDTESKLVSRVRTRDSAVTPARDTIIDVFELWAGDRVKEGKKRPATIVEDRKIVARFAEFVGKARPASTVTPAEVAEFRDTLKRLPPKWMSKMELRGKDMREAAVVARSLELEVMSLTNVNKHLSTISPLFTWMAEQPRWAGFNNPCRGLWHKGVKGRNRRPSFSSSDLNAILQSPLFVGFERDGLEHQSGDKIATDWRKWLPLICMFTGARIGEVAQLRIGDITESNGLWFFWIKHEPGQGLSTKSGKDRPVPMHSALKKMGLLSYHTARSKLHDHDKSQLLFPELSTDGKGDAGAMPSRWWRNYLEKIKIKSGRDGLGAHSFRHTLADRMRVEAELLDAQVAVCLGHDQSSTTGGYGQVPQGTARMLAEWIERVKFDGVDLKHLYAE